MILQSPMDKMVEIMWRYIMSNKPMPKYDISVDMFNLVMNPESLTNINMREIDIFLNRIKIYGALEFYNGIVSALNCNCQELYEYFYKLYMGGTERHDYKELNSFIKEYLDTAPTDRDKKAVALILTMCYHYVNKKNNRYQI